jgi:hypothetical protein
MFYKNHNGEIVEAHRFTKNELPRLWDWCGSCFEYCDDPSLLDWYEVIVTTKNGLLSVNNNDYVVRSESGDFSTLPEEVFIHTHTLVEV